MWKILKSEICYRIGTFVWISIASIVFYFFITGPWLFGQSQQQPANRSFFFLLFMLTVQGIYLILKSWSRENRDRQLMMLPIRLSSIGLVRFLLDLFLWLLLIILLFIYSLISPKFFLTSSFCLVLFLTSGSVLIVIAMASFWRDVVMRIKSRGDNPPADKILAGSLNFLIPGFFNLFAFMHLMMIIFAMRQENNVLTQLLKDPLFILSVTVSGILLNGLLIFLFSRQVSQIR
jgi:hypothetical protein